VAHPALYACATGLGRRLSVVPLSMIVLLLAEYTVELLGKM
jgi:hypothetical protein